ncbi:MAG: hypothetical protein ACRECO_12665, partial [Xanthobacteraceae bacterium]
GNQSFEFIETARFSDPGQIRYSHSAGYTLVLLNTDADGSYEGLIRLTGLKHPEANWFVA